MSFMSCWCPWHSTINTPRPSTRTFKHLAILVAITGPAMMPPSTTHHQQHCHPKWSSKTTHTPTPSVNNDSSSCIIMIQIQTSGHLFLLQLQPGLPPTTNHSNNSSKATRPPPPTAPPFQHSTINTPRPSRRTHSHPWCNHQQCILPAPAPSTTQMITMQSNSHHSHHTAHRPICQWWLFLHQHDSNIWPLLVQSQHCASHHSPLKQELQQRSNSSRSHTTVCQWLLHHQHQQPHSNTTISKLLQQTTALPFTPHFKLFPAPTTTQTTPKKFSTAPPTTPTKSLP